MCPPSPQERTVPPGAPSLSESSGKLWTSEDRWTVVVASRCAAYTPSSPGRRASTSTPSYPSWTRSTRSRAGLRSPARALLRRRSLLERIRPSARSLAALQAAPRVECVASCSDQRRCRHLRRVFRTSAANRAAASMWRGTRAVAARARLALAAVVRAANCLAKKTAVGSAQFFTSALPASTRPH